VLPGTFVVAGVVAAEVAIRSDRAGFARWLPSAYETTVVNARSVLGAIATGTITVVTLVLTLTLIAIQLAAGQLSPRTIIDYLEDRFQQVAIGIILGTAAYSLAALRALGPDDAPGQAPDLTVLVAFLLTMVSLLVLLASVDRMAERLQVGNLIDNIADETCALVLLQQPDDEEQERDLVSTDRHPVAVESVTAARTGWVQAIDESAMAAAVPDGSRLVIRHGAGSFVYEDMVMVELAGLGGPLDDASRAAIGRAIGIGDSRNMKQDIGFGLIRLVDIGLRALSPGINDPNTAREVVLRLGQILLRLQGVRLPGRSAIILGRCIDRPDALDHDGYADAALDQLRRAAVAHPEVLATIADTARTVIDESRRRGFTAPMQGLTRQLWLTERMLGRADGSPATTAASVDAGNV
jgi:uncharacterized membrane protein